MFGVLGDLEFEIFQFFYHLFRDLEIKWKLGYFVYDLIVFLTFQLGPGLLYLWVDFAHIGADKRFLVGFEICDQLNALFYLRHVDLAY